MKILIALNFAVGLLLTGCCIAGEKEFFCFLPLIVLVPSFFLLALANLAFIFIFWRMKRLRTFIPISTYIVAVAIFIVGVTWGIDLVLRGTPCSPDTFFTQQTKSDLTSIANELLSEYQGGKEYPPKISPALGAKLDRFKLNPISIDRHRQTVVVGYYHDYHNYEYIYSKDGMTNLPAKMQDPAPKNLGDNWCFIVW